MVNRALGNSNAYSNGYLAQNPSADVIARAKALGKHGRSSQLLEPLRDRKLADDEVTHRHGDAIRSTKMDIDMEEEYRIHDLQNQLQSVQDQLKQAKFKYEQRQLYELENAEKALKNRL